MIRLLLLSYLLVTPSFAAGLIAAESNEHKTALVELYTSEGCSSCPPAEQWLKALIEIPKDDLDLLALAFHVDYWDYLGWKDRFGSPSHTSRQRQLGNNNHQTSIYTPEFFVGGIEARGTRKVLDNIRGINDQVASIQLKLLISKKLDTLQLELQSASPGVLDKSLLYRYFVYESQLMSDVKRGENSGKQLTHQNVVRYMSPEQNFKQFNQHQILINPEWHLGNIGVAALVTTQNDDDYLQVVHTPITPLLNQ